MDAETWPVLDCVPPLTAEEVHVWQVRLDYEAATEAGFAALLSADERERADRFVQPRDRRRFVAARGSLRQLLGEYLETVPASIALSATRLGKPYLSDPAGGIRFNVAHSADLALLAFAHGRDIGVDVEQERADVDWEELARRYFSAEEIAALTSEVTKSERRQSFYRCWTRKEAYVKGLGQGLQVPLAGFAVTVTGPAALLHTGHDPIQRDRWELCDLVPAAGFAAAVCVEGRGWRLRRATHAAFR